MTTTADLDDARATAGELTAALAAGQVSAAELTDRAIGRIEARDGDVNAVVVRDFDRAREAARAADEALARGDRRPLLGVPMTVKESFDLEGHPTTWGLEPFRAHRAKSDALAVQRLKAAGAVVLGKTNVPPGLGDWQSANPLYGRTNNPLDLSRSPGGSSGGGAAALAAGYVPLELGSDIGGSIRVPAAFCGVWGHKPSYDLLPTRGHAPGGLGAAEPPLAVIGPLARSAADLVTALKVLAGPDEALGGTRRTPLPAPRAEQLSELRVLVLDEHPAARVSGEVKAAVAAAAGRLADAGARVERGEGRIPDLQAVYDVYVRMLNTVTSRGAPGGRAPISAHDWLAALDRQMETRLAWGALFQHWDAVLAPCFGTAAFPHVDEADWSLRTLEVDGEAAPYGRQLAWASIATFGCLPSTAFPAGRAAAGLPIGLQAIGPFSEDLTAIRLAELLAV